MDTKASRVAPALLLLALLAGCWLPAAGKRLRLGNCAITVHVHELRHNFNEMRQNVVKQDQQIGVRFLTKQTMKDIQLSESCCFLKHLLRFYVERVFSSYTTTASQHRKSTSNLANSFLSIKRDLRQCHDQMLCECHEETRVKLESIRATFDKLETKDAVVKAVSELDFLLDWMESFAL
ncbi:interleukin 19 like [Scleropages formosus]|uniref:interleukin 19 like n=1 Tax=Scleropages formosus TaxID=113540 RepID=UPI000878B2DE|nr:interleukin-20-like [Scleropages formosus]